MFGDNYNSLFNHLLFIILIFNYVRNYKIVNINRIWVDFIKINRKRNTSSILFYPFIGCGYANIIPTLLSSLLLSVVSFHPIFIVNWKLLLFYFHFPKSLFIQKYIHADTKLYDRKNSSILNLLKMNMTIKIYTYHSYTNYVLYYYNLTNNLKILIKQKQKEQITLEMLLHQIFLKPTKDITNYIKTFKKYTKKYYVIGIHIRTGYLSDFGEKDKRFYNNNTISLYKSIINNIINKYKTSRLYIISDSTLVRQYLSKLYKNKLLNLLIPGKICHARSSMRGNQEFNECVVKLIAENYILSECNVIIGSRKSTYFGMACNRKRIICIAV